jgi:hypothetical protein
MKTVGRVPTGPTDSPQGESVRLAAKMSVARQGVAFSFPSRYSIDFVQPVCQDANRAWLAKTCPER